MIAQQNRLRLLIGAIKRLGRVTAPSVLKPVNKPAANQRFRVVNLTRDTVLASSLEVADTGKTRGKGLLGRESLSSGEGLWIIPCESVHTFFMRFAIDLVYLDREKRVKKLRCKVVPWRMSACLSAHSVLELPSGIIGATRTQCGDKLEFWFSSDL